MGGERGGEERRGKEEEEDKERRRERRRRMEVLACRFCGGRKVVWKLTFCGVMCRELIQRRKSSASTWYVNSFPCRLRRKRRRKRVGGWEERRLPSPALPKRAPLLFFFSLRLLVLLPFPSLPPSFHSGLGEWERVGSERVCGGVGESVGV